MADLRASLEQRFPGKPVAAMSALAGGGVDEWLDYVLKADPAAPHAVAVDYDTYAAGEAALGWLNTSVILRPVGTVNWRSFAEGLLSGIREELGARAAEIAHLKLVIRQGEHAVTGNVTSNAGAVSLLGPLAETAGEAGMQLNVRRADCAGGASGNMRAGFGGGGGSAPSGIAD